MQKAPNQKLLEEILRPKLLEKKTFLRTLYKGNKRLIRSTLNFASGYELRILGKIIHYVVTGVIPLFKESFMKIHRSKKLKLLQKLFESSSSYRSFFRAQRKEKVAILYKFISIYCYLLEPLFELKH